MDQVLEPVGDDDNRIMIEFYESHLEFLKTYPIHALRDSVFTTAAVMFHSSSYYNSDWREYAYEVGVKENLHLDTIEQSAERNKELPLYVTMTKTLKRRNGNLGNLIKAFIKTGRYDILRLLKPYVEEFLEGIPDTKVVCTKKQQQALKEKTSDLSSDTTEEVNCETISSMFNIYTGKSKEVPAAEFNPISLKKHTAVEFNALTKNCAYQNPTSEVKYPSSKFSELSFYESLSDESVFLSSLPKESISLFKPHTESDIKVTKISACRNPMPEMKLYPSSKSRELSHDESLSLKSTLPSVRPEEFISVLILHTENDIKVAKQVCEKLNEEGIAASTLCEMERLIRSDFEGALNKIFQEVNFIVPVVSEEFLRQIDSESYGNFDAMCNKFLFKEIKDEYERNEYRNYRVRPVLVPGMKECQESTNHVILAYSFQLWIEWEKLIRNLNETKELIKLQEMKKNAVKACGH